MDKLLKYLNSLDKPARRAFCDAIGMSENHLRKSISTKARLKPEVCVAIEEYPDSPVGRVDLHPEDWQRIWPELAEKVA